MSKKHTAEKPIVHPCNVDGITPSQLGKGWRLVDHKEKPNLLAQLWDGSRWKTRRNWFCGYESKFTYRVPNPTPVAMIDKRNPPPEVQAALTLTEPQLMDEAVRWARENSRGTTQLGALVLFVRDLFRGGAR